MAWWTPIAALTGINTLLGQRPDQALLNAGINTATGNFINQIAPNFGTNMGLLNQQDAVNLGQPSGVASAGSFNPALRTGFQAVEPTRGMAETLARQTQNVTPDVTQNLGQPMTPAYRNINPALVADQNKLTNIANTGQTFTDGIADQIRPPFENVARGQSVDFTGGGYEESMMSKAYKNIKKSIEDDPVTAGLIGLTLGGSIYQGINPPQRPVQPPSTPGISRGGAVALGQPLQVRRPR